MQSKGSYIQTALVIAILLTAAYLVWSQEVRLRKNTLRNQATSLADHLQGRIDQLWTSRSIILKSAVGELVLAHTEPSKSKDQALRDLKLLAPEITSASLWRPGQAPELLWQDLAPEARATNHSTAFATTAQLLYGESSRLFMQGEEALLVFMLDSGDPSSPLATATLSLPAMIRTIMPPDIDDYAIELIDARNQLVYQSAARLPFYAPERMDWQVTRILQLAGHTCALNVIPGPALIARTYLQPNTWVLGIGILVTLCVAMLLNQQNRLRLKDREIYEANLRKLALFEMNREEAERRDISAELHDDVGHALSLLKMEAESASAAESPFPKSLIRHLDGAIQSVRAISSRLHPPLLPNTGLAPAIEDLVAEFTASSRISVKVDLPDRFPALGRERQWALYRAIKEGLTNAARHAGADAISISAKADKKMVRLKLVDNGKGFDPSVIHSGHSLGLLSLTERVQQTGGQAAITSSAGKGTTIRIEMPI